MIVKPIKLSNQQSSNQYSKTAQGLTLLWWALLWVVLFYSLSTSHAYETGQSSGEGSYKINLSPDVKNALDNGIMLTFDCELKTEQKLWLLSLPKNQTKHSFTLTHHSLSNRYLIHYNDAQPPQNFDSSGEAMGFISQQSIKLLNQYAINQSNAKMRLSLNKFKLLGPMRLNAFIAEQWDIDTGWISWSPEI